MSDQRRRFTAEKKIEILREHLKNDMKISEDCERYCVHPNLYYRWEKQLFEGAVGIFSVEGSGKGRNGREAVRERKLVEKITRQQEVISWLTEENLKLKKTLGEG
ncbi:MAG: transposase [Thermoplasmata archaeon]